MSKRTRLMRKYRRRYRQNGRSNGGVTQHTQPHGRTGRVHSKKLGSRRRFALIVLVPLFVTACGKGGEHHWEPTYNIDVVDVQTRDSGGIVIYERNGETCAAAQAPDGVLIDIGCNEVKSRG